MFSDGDTEQSEFLTVRQAAKRLGYSHRRVRQLLKEGKLQGHKVEGGRKWLIPKQAIDRYLQIPQDVPESDVCGQPVQRLRKDYIERLGKKAEPGYGRDEHIRGLSYFGQCLGEWLSPYALEELVPGRAVSQDDLWFRSNSSQGSRPRDYLEKKVAEELGVGRCDLRKHSLFKCFQQHLPEPSCWSVLEQLADNYRQYLEAGQQAYNEVLHRIKPKLVDFSLSEADAQSIADSLMTYAYHDGDFKFPYELHQSQHEGQISWDLKLGAWNVGYKEAREKLKLVLEQHRGLVREVLSWEAIQTFIQKHADAERKTEEFKQYLKPPLKLENLLWRSYCDWCR